MLKRGLCTPGKVQLMLSVRHEHVRHILKVKIFVSPSETKPESEYLSDDILPDQVFRQCSASCLSVVFLPNCITHLLRTGDRREDYVGTRRDLHRGLRRDPGAEI